MSNKSEKRILREAIIEVSQDSYIQSNSFGKELLKILASFALAWEIENSIKVKVNRKHHKLHIEDHDDILEVVH